MNPPVTHTRPAGVIRLLCLAACLLIGAPSALAATLEWQALPDRERVSITMGESGGLAGAIGRIAPTGVIIPFTDVPAGLHVGKPPEGAAIFQGTKQQGRALVLVTQTPEFGFVVTRQTNAEIVVDFFRNPLGARWKPTQASPTTEVAPNILLGPIADPDAATRSLQADPQGQTPESAAMQADLEARYAEMQAVLEGTPPAETAPQTPAPVPTPGPAPEPNPAPVPTPAPPAQAPVQPPVQPAEAAGADAPEPAPALPNELPPPVKPVVVLSGSPLHATRSTQMLGQEPDPLQAPGVAGGETLPPDAAQAPDQSGQPTGLDAAPVQPPEQAAGQTAGQAAGSDISIAPIVDSRAQTAARSAPLPQPQPPLASATLSGAGTAAVSGVISPEGAQPSLQPQTQPAAQPPAPPSVQQSAQQPSPGQTVPAAPAAQQQPAVPAEAPTETPPAQAAPAYDPAAPLPPGVGVRQRPGLYGGSINTGGLDTIPQGDFSSARPAPPVAQGSVSAPVRPVSAEEALRPPVETPQEPPKEIVYTDAEGNPVEPPPNPAALMPEIVEHVKAGQFQEALDKATALLERGILTPEQREEMLHVRAEMLFAVNKDNLAEHYLAISDASTQAINFNQKSWRNAAALLRLGYMNLKLNKIPEAEARFNMLRRLFPDDENVPLTYYYWGDYHFGRGELQRAADEFQYVLQQYPNSRYARESALGLARSFYQLGYYEQSYNVVDYIERRWERFYVQYPPFLNMMGDVAYRLNRLDVALKNYWLYLNLEPKGAEADIILTRIGDIYAQQREKVAARELYNESMHRFPDKDGGLVAMMRLAEEGVNDDPTIAGMFSLFDGPYSLAPVEVYRAIITKHPESALVPLAELKLALWHLWNKDYTQALDMLSALEQKYPDHELAPKAREIALQTFAVIAAESRQDQRFGRMRDLWEKYPIVRGQEETLNPESRITLGVSYRQDGNPNEALKVVEPFFLGNKIPEYSEMALSLVLSIYLEHDQWESIREVARRVETWELGEDSKRQLDYSLALAAENLGESGQAAPIWQRLYDSGKLPPAQMAYAAFFLARDAERARELEKAYHLGSEALSRLMTQVERTPNAADVGKIQTQLASLMDVAETAGRLREALGFAEQYLQYIPPGDGERQAVRYRMARIYKKQGDNETWRKLLGEITAEAPDSVYGRLSASELNAANLAQDAAQYSPTGQL